MSDDEMDNGMLDCQHQLIARVVLAGWTFDSMTSTRTVNAGYRDGKWQKGERVPHTEWRMLRTEGGHLPLTTEWCEDQYGAACEAFKLMQDYEPQDTSIALQEGAFELREDNAEPENERQMRLWRRRSG